MSAYQRSARRLVGAVGLILGGLTVSALADTGDRTTKSPATAAPTAATAPVPAATMPTAFTASADPAVRAAQARRTFSTPTNSSPIALSARRPARVDRQPGRRHRLGASARDTTR